MSGWGKKGDEIMCVLSVIDELFVFVLDRGDLNYDSTEESFGLRAAAGDVKLDVVVEYKNKVEMIINEYFNFVDIDEVWISVEKLDVFVYEYFFVKRFVIFVMDWGY